MPGILDTRISLDQTVRIFDSFYSFDLNVNGSEFDVVYSYFKSVCSTLNIASNFTVVLFRISQETGTSVIDLLGYLKGTNKLEMNRIITYYLNSFKSKTTLYGISVVPQPNQLVARNILQ
jgi:hypothetical protein